MVRATVTLLALFLGYVGGGNLSGLRIGLKLCHVLLQHYHKSATQCLSCLRGPCIITPLRAYHGKLPGNYLIATYKAYSWIILALFADYIGVGSGLRTSYTHELPVKVVNFGLLFLASFLRFLYYIVKLQQNPTWGIYVFIVTNHGYTCRYWYIYSSAI